MRSSKSATPDFCPQNMGCMPPVERALPSSDWCTLVEGERALVHRVIFDELCLGVIRDESRAAFVDVINHLVERGAQGVILGCTELELLLTSDDANVPLFPTTRLHIEAAVNQALDSS